MIKFFRGLKSLYNEKHFEDLYFTTDTYEILHKGQSYSGLLEEEKSVVDVTISDNILNITYSDGSTSKILLSSGKYESAIEDKGLVMPNSVGGITKNTKVSDLEGKTYNSILDDLLFPTVYPSYIEPSASITLSNYSNIQEVGTNAPALNNFITKYNAGQIILNGVTQDTRGGIEKEHLIYCGNIDAALPTKIAEGSVEYVYRVVYEQGPQPKDNKGNNYGTPLESGFVEASVTINGTYPWYATTLEKGVLTKQKLVQWASNMSSGEFTLQPHTKDQPQQFKLPRQAKKLQMYNTVAKAFEEVSISDWEETINTTNNRSYYTYSYLGENRGSVKLIVTF